MKYVKTSKTRLLAERISELQKKKADLLAELAALDKTLEEFGIAERVLASLGASDLDRFEPNSYHHSGVLAEAIAVQGNHGAADAVDRIMERMSNKQLILKVMSSGEPMHKEEIFRQVLEISTTSKPATLAVELSRFAGAGIMKSEGKGFYRLIAGESPSQTVVSSNDD